LGDFEGGWREYEWRLHQFAPHSGYPMRHGLPLWVGQPIQGRTILVYDEQGYGDSLMFSRYLSLLKAAGARVVFEARPALLPLFKLVDSVDEVVLRQTDRKPQNPCDFCCPLASLPGRFNTDASHIPNKVPYLRASISKKAYWQKRLRAQGLKVGLVWSGSDVDPSRRCSLASFATLAQNSHVNWFGLQKQDPAEQAACQAWIENLGPCLKDFSDTAAIIENLDLLISIDTATAHLAGALGKPVWVLLPYVADWRWFLDRQDSPWYPSMRLFRQIRVSDWQSPLNLVRTALSQWLSTPYPAKKNGIR
jgi:ADP-heptose:LPS heptosyltransferase